MKKAYRYQVILDTEKDVVRELEIYSEDTFENLHKALLESFNFQNTEMASFYMSSNDWDKGEEITLMSMASADGIDEQAGIIPAPMMADTSLSLYMEGTGTKMIYVFDFLLMWCFYIELIEEIDSDEELPRCSKKMGEAPNQNDKDADETLLGDSVASEIADIMSGFEDEEDDGEARYNYNE
ncbi:MAG: hypothetical protein HRT72_07485 [Flavobacteriales bacterium]|nr:hypothetical protein [Flavobacteriales bacterium]